MYIYIISNEINVKESRYKIGRHAGSQGKLVQRYKTPLVNPIIYLFYPCSDAMLIETIILKVLDDNRIRDDNNRKTEWIQLPLIDILQKVLPVLSKSKDPRPDYILNRNDDDSDDTWYSDVYDLGGENIDRKHESEYNLRKTLKELCGEKESEKEDEKESENEGEKESNEYTKQRIIPRFHTVEILSGNDSYYVEKLTIDCISMTYNIIKISKEDSEQYLPTGYHRPRELDLTVIHGKNKSNTRTYFHKGHITYVDYMIPCGCDITKLWYPSDDYAHIISYTIINNNIKLFITQRKDNTIFISKTKVDDNVGIWITFLLEGDENEQYKSHYLNLIPAVPGDITHIEQYDKITNVQPYDDIDEFIAFETDDDYDQYVLSSVLYRQYYLWCKSRNQDAKGHKTFSQVLEKKYKKERKRNGQCFIGIRLKERDLPSDEPPLDI